MKRLISVVFILLCASTLWAQYGNVIMTKPSAAPAACNFNQFFNTAGGLYYCNASGTPVLIASGSVASSWDTITNAAGNLALSNANYTTTFNQTSAVNWTWANTTAAIVGTPQNPPIFVFAGKYWNGSASATDSWTMHPVLTAGTNGASTLTLTHSGSSGAANFSLPGNLLFGLAGVADSGRIRLLNADPMCWRNFANSNNKCLTLAGSDVFAIDASLIFPAGGGISSLDTGLPALTFGTNSIIANQPLTVPELVTANCTSSASPAVCGANPAGSVVIAASATSIVVNTTAVTANSQILVTEDQSLGTKLTVTCDTTSPLTIGPLFVSARVAATSFTISSVIASATNPVCVSYFIVN